jgi:gamma-glutamylcyclotransferase (GGCT)/AIG2-like uncharacterized protein YtfP
MKKAQEYLFSYGTLQKENFQLGLLGKTLKGTGDSLRGYQLCLYEIKACTIAGHHPMAMPTSDKDDIIDGTVFEILKEDLRLLDSYATDDYKRVKEVLESGREAWVYVRV